MIMIHNILPVNSTSPAPSCVVAVVAADTTPAITVYTLSSGGAVAPPSLTHSTPTFTLD